MGTLACLYPHTLIFESNDWIRLPATVKAMLALAACRRVRENLRTIRLQYGEEGWMRIRQVCYELTKQKVAFGYIYTPEA